MRIIRTYSLFDSASLVFLCVFVPLWPTQIFEQVSLFPSHFNFIVAASFMIISDEMEQAVNEESVDLPVYALSGSRSLTYRSRNRDDDIAQEFRVDMGKLPLPEREREHIRDGIVPPVFPVQGTDGPVTGEKNA